MAFDALTIAAVRQELERKVVGGRIQRAIVPAPLTVALELYRAGTGRCHLVLSAHPQHARLYLTSNTPTRDPEQQPPLLLLLRKYVRGGTLLRVSQPPNERVLALSIVKTIRAGKHQEYHSDPYFLDTDEGEETDDFDDGGEQVEVELIVEIMGRLSNIVLVEADGTVMDAIKRIPSSINRYRTTLPHRPYVAPPPQEKRDASQSSINAFSLELSRTGDADAASPAWRGLVNGFAGVSPTVAREAIYRALGGVDIPAREVAARPEALEAIRSSLLGLLDLQRKGTCEPTVAWRAGQQGSSGPLDFAPFRLTHLEAQGATLEGYAEISQAVETFYASAAAVGSHGALREQVRAEIEEIRSRDRRRLQALTEQASRAQAAEDLRRKGEMIFAYMHTLQPGQHVISLPEERLTIQLDTSLTPVENAQAYFKEYHKARSAQEDLPGLIEQTELQLRFLDELGTSLDFARSVDDIKGVRADLQLARYPAGRAPEAGDQAQSVARKKRGEREKLPQLLRFTTQSGAQVLVGRNARQNDMVTFRLATPDDLWFHVRGAPGSHVILRATAEGAGERDLEEAAEIAAGYSSLNAESMVDVIYTEKRNVRRIPNAPPGLVTYKGERTIRVSPRRK